MSAGESAPGAGPEFRPFMQLWAESMAQVLGQIAGISFGMETLESAPADAVPPQASDLKIMVACSGGLRGEMALSLPQAAARSVAQIFLGESPNPAAEFSSDHREAVEELFRQIAGYAATAIRPQWGETQLRVEFGAAPSWPAGADGWINSAADTPVRLWLEWQMSAALLASLRAAVAPAPAEASPSPTPEVPSAPELPGRMNLFLDVELEVALRFGGRRMLLREVLELNGGAVIELDRQVQEPADLLLDGKVIARGEVVVVDGNYGLRVLEVLELPGTEPAQRRMQA